LIASLQREAAIAQAESDKAALQLVLAMVPGIAEQLYSTAENWSLTDDKILIQYSPPERQQKRSDNSIRYAETARPLIVSAFLRERLIREVPVSEQTAEDSRQAATFTKVVAGEAIRDDELFKASRYLKDLAKRISVETIRASS
jgi:hypothetical protein